MVEILLRLIAALLLSVACSVPVAAQTAIPGLTTPGAASETEPAPAEPAPEELEDLIATLEDDAERARLIARLRLLLDAREPEPSAPSAAEVTGEALKEISAAVAEVSNDFIAAAAGLDALPGLRAWLRQQIEDQNRQRLWLQVLISLASTLGAGYAGLYLSRLALMRTRRRITSRAPGPRWARVGPMLLVALLDLVPVALFAIAAYLTLTLVDAAPVTRLVALAWINAVILVRLIDVAARALFAPEAPGLRIPVMDDEAAREGRAWTGRLARLAVYGWFGLQAGRFAGLSQPVVEALLRLLGLLLTLMAAALILRIRKPIARWIAGPPGTATSAVRGRLAFFWHLPALVYLFLLYGVWALQIENGFGTMAQRTLLTLAVIAAAALIARAADRLFARPPDLGGELPPRLSGLRERLCRYVPALRIIVRGLILIVTVLAVLQVWGVDAFAWFSGGPGQVLAATAGSLALTLLIALTVWEAASLAFASYLAEHDGRGTARVRSARARTLLAVARTTLMVTLSVVVLLIVLSELGINIAPLLATAGVLGLAVGFGAQKLVQDVITGFFILLEDVFSVGDVIQVGDRSGLVEAVSVRNVRLRDLSGTVHTIPFSTIDRVSNLTREFSFYVFDLGVAYREDVDEVMATLRDIGRGLRADPHFGTLILDDLEVFGVDAFGDSAVVIKGRVKTRPIKQWEVGRELNRRIKQRFDELGIEIPFPHRTLYFGIDKQGTAPPVRMARADTSGPEDEARAQIGKGTQ